MKRTITVSAYQNKTKAAATDTVVKLLATRKAKVDAIMQPLKDAEKALYDAKESLAMWIKKLGEAQKEADVIKIQNMIGDKTDAVEAREIMLGSITPIVRRKRTDYRQKDKWINAEYVCIGKRAKNGIWVFVAEI